MLLALETVCGMVCEAHESCDGQVKRVIWVLIVVTYVIILLCLISCYNTCGAYESHAHIGPISGVVAFEFLHAVIFWFSFILFVSGAVTNSARPLLISPDLIYAFIPGTIYMYVMMWVGSTLYYKRHIQTYKEIFSKQEAIDILNQKLLEPPAIEIRIKCVCHPVLTNGSKFVSTPLLTFT